MNDVKPYGPIGLLLIAALIVTGIAGAQYAGNPNLANKDGLGIALWFTPLAYLLLTWLFTSTQKLNRWPIAVAGVAVYALSAFLLFVPVLPPGLEWHYPIAAAGLILLFSD